MTEAQQRAYDQAQVMLAFSQGKKVESNYLGTSWWKEVQPGWEWNFASFRYRIAPEPQEVWLWVKEGRISYVDSPGIELSERGYTKKLFREVLP